MTLHGSDPAVLKSLMPNHWLSDREIKALQQKKGEASSVDNVLSTLH